MEAAADVGLTVLLVTKGDLFHQESKVARSGFGDLVDDVEVVAEKDPATYRRILRRYGIEPDRLPAWSATRCAPTSQPVLALGGWAVARAPRAHLGARARADDEGSLQQHPRFRLLPSLVELPTLLDELTP